jgi:two-component system, NtrC family, sensor kinase
LKLDYVRRDINVLVEESNDGIKRVNAIVENLRTFSKADSSATGKADLNSCMETTINLLKNEIHPGTEIKRDYGKIQAISCNVQQINQVLLNLLLNALHAVQTKADSQRLIGVSTWSEDNDVFVSVSDTGCGIAAENCHKIYDAFYTTKELGKGTGLGLSIAAEIVQKHGGEIMMTTAEGVGSTFTVRLPV